MNSTLLDSIFSEELFSVAPRPAIILSQPWEKANVDERDLLYKILSAIKLSPDTISIRHQSLLDLSGWSVKPRQVVFFGDPVKGIIQYEVVEASGVSIVTSAGLSELLRDDASRKKLWQALKKQFSV